MTLKRTMYKKKLRQKVKTLREEADERAINVMKLKMRGVLDQYSEDILIHPFCRNHSDVLGA